MKIHLGRLTLLVRDYEEAFAFYHAVFNCKKLYDQTAANGRRYLHIGFDKSDVGIWLLKADTPFQLSLVGKQTGGQPLLVLYTSALDELLERARKMKVEITRPPTRAEGAAFFHMHDLYGNELVVVELES